MQAIRLRDALFFLGLGACALLITTVYSPASFETVHIPDDERASMRKLLQVVPIGPTGVVLNAIMQPTTFLRVALLLLRNSVDNNPTQEFLQMILSTDFGHTKFTNVFASFASGVIQDFSSGVTTDTVLTSEWAVDGTSTLDNTVFTEFFAGGAFGIEQFFGWGFEMSGLAAAAIQQFLSPKDESEYEYEQEYVAPIEGEPDRRRRRLLSASEAKARKLPVGSEIVHQVQHPLDGDVIRRAAGRALRRVNGTEPVSERRSLSEVEEVTYTDVEEYTTNWFESFPAALPLAIRDRFIALLEEFVVDPQIRISLDVTVALVGVATPGVGITTYEAAAENTVSTQVVFHGYDAAVDFATSIDPAVAVAGSISKGVAIANAIDDATKILGAVTSIVDEVNNIIEQDGLSREAGDEVAAQGGSNETLTERVARWLRPMQNDSAITRPRGVDTTRATHFTSLGQNSTPVEEDESADARGPYDVYEPLPVDGDYEPLGAVSGTYAVAVSLIFLQQIALNGGSITVI